jgi:N-acetylglucosaminyl-diphospho-decaprenol L-rhamnosyltransferase
VVVVDNASGDGSCEMCVCKYPDVLLIRNEKNTGFSVANNQGIRTTESRHVLLLNPDTEVRQGALTAMVRFLDEHPHVGVVGCQLLNTDGSLQQSWFNFPVPFSRYFDRLGFSSRFAGFALGIKCKHDRIVQTGVKKVDIIKGACLMIRREAVNQIGLLDENSFLYADDIDWCIRTARRCWDTYAITDQNILHHGYASTSQEQYLTIVSSRRSAMYLYRKHYSWPFVCVWSTLIFLEVCYKWQLNSLRVKAGRKDETTLARHKAYTELAKGFFNRKNSRG